MISLEFTGQLTENARTEQQEGKLVLCFPVRVTRRMKENGTYRTSTTVIHCRKVGAFAVDAKFRRGLRVYIRGDISAKVDNNGAAQLNCTVWQFETL